MRKWRIVIERLESQLDRQNDVILNQMARLNEENIKENLDERAS